MSKRGQNEGSVYKRKRDGLWVAQVTIQGKHVSKYFKSQKDARVWLQDTISQIQIGLSLSSAKKTVGEHLTEWLDSYKASVRPKTIEQYSQIVRQHIMPYLGQIKLKDLRPDQIQALYTLKLNSGVSPRTVILVHAVLHRSLLMALKWGMIGRNPVDAVNRPKFKRKEMKTLNDTQARTFLSNAQGTRFEVLFWLAIATGLRQGELLGLKWSDVEWNQRRLRITRQVQRLHGGLEFTEPKSAAGKRVIVLGTGTTEKLRRQLEILTEQRLLAGELWKECDMVFPSTIGTPMDPSNLYHEFKRILKKAGLPDIRFHDLRHTAATLMLQQGTHPKVVQERLGHSDISLTLNTYSHVLPSMQEEAAERLEELLVPINVSDEIKKLGEQSFQYVVSNQVSR
jgi:integrase